MEPMRMLHMHHKPFEFIDWGEEDSDGDVGNSRSNIM